MVTVLEYKNWQPLVHHRLISYAQHFGYLRFSDMVLDICQKYYGKTEIILAAEKKHHWDILNPIVNSIEKYFKLYVIEYDLCSICSPTQ